MTSLGRLEEALPCFDKAIELEPQIATYEIFKIAYEAAKNMLTSKEYSSGDKRALGDDDIEQAEQQKDIKKIKSEPQWEGDKQQEFMPPIAVKLETDVSTLGESSNPITFEDFSNS